MWIFGDLFGEHDKTDEQPGTGETIPFTPGGVIEGGNPYFRTRKETSFRGGKTQRTRLKESFVEKLFHVLSEETGQTPEVLHFDNFEHINAKLYYKGKSASLTIKRRKLRSFREIVKILGKERFRDLGFNIPIEGILMDQEQIESLVEFTRKIRHESGKSTAWHHWSIVSWILNKAAGWVLQNLWALVVGIRGLLYTYIVMKK